MLKRSVSWCALLLACGAALRPAHAVDQPANDAGVKTIQDFVSTYMGPSAQGSIKVTPQGNAYLVDLDIGTATQAMNAMGFSYDPATIKLKAFQQDDGQWRIEQNGFTPLTGHMRNPPNAAPGQLDVKVDAGNFTSRVLLDPKLGWFSGGRASVDKLNVAENGPGLDEHLEFLGLKANMGTKTEDGGLTSVINEPFDAVGFAMHIDPAAMQQQPPKPGQGPVNIVATGKTGTAHIDLKNFQPRPITDFLSFAANHPDRASYAKDGDALKTKVMALIGDHLTLDESFKLDSLSFEIPSGKVDLDNAMFGVTVVNNGDSSGFGEHIAAHNIKLPDGLIPAPFASLAPTEAEIAFFATGFDAPSAAQEWLADAKFDGDGPVLSQSDKQRVWAKLVMSHPVVINVRPSHISGPNLDIAFEGKVTVDAGKPFGGLNVKVRDFDKTVQAVQALGPDVQQKAVPVIAMAKGLGKQMPDGQMQWQIDLGRDGVVKVNGLPLGKAPQTPATPAPN